MWVLRDAMSLSQGLDVSLGRRRYLCEEAERRGKPRGAANDHHSIFHLLERFAEDTGARCKGSALRGKVRTVVLRPRELSSTDKPKALSDTGHI